MKCISIIALSFALATAPIVFAHVPDGWARKDRFSGFRYELHGRVAGVGLLEAIRDKADDLACFGWAQETESGTVAGEARCNKRMGAKLREWMDSPDQHPSGTFVERAHFLEYEDTLIKLHFSHFKLLDPERETCFPDTPHQCARFRKKPHGQFRSSTNFYHGKQPPEISREL